MAKGCQSEYKHVACAEDCTCCDKSDGYGRSLCEESAGDYKRTIFGRKLNLTGLWSGLESGPNKLRTSRMMRSIDASFFMTTRKNPGGWRTPTGTALFFFLHCRTSARHGRSTTGMSLWLRTNFPKERNQQPTQQTTTKTSNAHTQAKARARQNSQGNLQTKWNQVKHTRPSQPLKCSRPPCSTPPRCPIVKCQPYQYLLLDTQASL